MRGPRRYILIGREPRPEPDLMCWAMWMEAADRHVAWTAQEGFEVSTVFLGLDHQFGHGRPLLFETMIFTSGSFRDQACRRYATWAEAERGHREMVGLMLEMNAQAARRTEKAS